MKYHSNAPKAVSARFYRGVSIKSATTDFATGHLDPEEAYRAGKLPFSGVLRLLLPVFHTLSILKCLFIATIWHSTTIHQMLRNHVDLNAFRCGALLNPVTQAVALSDRSLGQISGLDHTF